MRWFKHDCDMHTNLKVQELIDREGAEGYAVWCICLEFIGKEGRKGKIESEKRWQKGILKVLQWSDKGKLDKILNTIAELRLINPKSFNYGNLHIPEFWKRSDDWTRYLLRSNSVVTSPRIDKSRIDKIRTEYIRIKGWSVEDFSPNDYGRTAKAIKTLINRARGDDEVVVRSLTWASRQKWCDWTLETVIKKWQDFMKEKTKAIYVKPKSNPNCEICKGTGKIQEGQNKNAQCPVC